MKLVIGSDKSGFTLKEAVAAYLKQNGHSVMMVGTVDAEKGIPFYQVAPLAAKMIQNGEAEKGILICGTGMGMSQVANKFKGVRAACVESVYAAKMSRAINDSNILCMGGWLIAPELGIQIAKAFLETEHTQDLEEWRKKFLKDAKAKFGELEDEIYGPARKN